MTLASPIPPATLHARQVSPKIRTSVPGFGGQWVRAEYIDLREYDDPNEAPIYARLSAPAPQFDRPRWTAEVLLHTIAENEVLALEAMLDVLSQLGIEPEPEAVVVAAELRTARERKLPWEQQPLLARGAKPRPAKTKWTTHTGKQIDIYKDTGKPHRDPNCTCIYCSPPPPAPEEY